MMALLNRIKNTLFVTFPIPYYWCRLIKGKEYRFVSLDYYSRKCPSKIRFLYKGKERFYYSELYGGNLEGDWVNQFVVCINNASCFAGSDSIILEGSGGKKYIFNEFKCIRRLRGISDCSESNVLFTDAKCWHITRCPNETEIIDSGIFLSGTFSFNYYHFTYAFLPKLLSCDNVVDADIPILVDENILSFSSFNELLRICNKKKRRVIILKYGIRYVIKKLYLVSSSMFMPLNLMEGQVLHGMDTQYNIKMLTYLRELILENKSLQNDLPHRFFISRSGNHQRELQNEYECFNAIEQFGFVKVSPEQYSLEQQVTLFNGADFIVGCSGAAFTNILYCPNGCNVVCLNGFEMPLSLWSTIANMNGVKFYTLFDKNKGLFSKHNMPQDIHSSFEIEANELKNIVESLVFMQS